jgi:hypothetical protein
MNVCGSGRDLTVRLGQSLWSRGQRELSRVLLGKQSRAVSLQELSLGGGSSRLAPDAAGVHVL